MHGLMENAIYGGRVDNIYDMRVLQSYLVQLFDSKLLTGEVAIDTIHISGNLDVIINSDSECFDEIIFSSLSKM